MADEPNKIVVFGANSFSGQDFVDLVLEETQAEVIGISRSAERSELFLRYLGNANRNAYRYHQLDVNRDMPAILNLLDREKPSWIVNFAAQSEVAPSWENPDQWFRTNTVALAQLVNHLRHQDYLDRYLHISSPEAYGNCVGVVKEGTPDNPSTPYAASKAAADMILDVYRRQYGFPLLTVRATNVYGARQQLFKIIPRAFIYIKSGQTIELHGGGVAVKSYIHIRDISRGELAVLLNGAVGAMYHLSPDNGISIRELVERIADVTGADFAKIARIVDERPGQDAAYVIDSAKARQELDWTPGVRLDEGLEDVRSWVDHYWTEIQSLPMIYEHKP